MKLFFLNNRSEFFKNVFKLGIGTTIAQILPFLLTPLLSRIYSPEQFSDFSIFMSIVSIFGLIGTLRYELAIVITKYDTESIKIIKLCFLILLFISIIGYIVINFILPKNLYTNINNYSLHLSILGIFFIGSTNVFQHWYNRIKMYNLLAKAKIVNSIGNILFSLTFGYLGFLNNGLILGYLMGFLSFFLILFIPFIKQKKIIKHKTNYKKIKKIAIEYKEFPLFNTLQAVLDSLQINGLLYVLIFFFNSTIIGLFSFALKILQAPMWLIGTSVTQIYYKEASNNYNNNIDITPTLKKSLKLSVLISFPITLIIIFLGPFIFSFVFGKQWEESGAFASILAPFFFTDLIKYTISQTLLIVKKNKTLLLLSLISNLIIFISIFIGGYFFKNIKITFSLLSISMTLYNLFIINWIYSSVKKQIWNKNT